MFLDYIFQVKMSENGNKWKANENEVFNTGPSSKETALILLKNKKYSAIPSCSRLVDGVDGALVVPW